MLTNFKNLNGHLAIKGKVRMDKFCEQCGAKVQNNIAKQRIHCNTNHGGDLHGFLVYGNRPLNSLYINFEAYLHNPDIMLIEDQTKITKRTGRPTKAYSFAKALFDSAHQYELDTSIKNDIDQ